MKEQIISSLETKIAYCKARIEREKQLALKFVEQYGDSWDNEKSVKHLKERMRQERLVGYYSHLKKSI